MSKKLHVNCFLVGNSQVEDFRQLVRTYNEPAGGDEEYQAEGFVEPEPSVEILYEEAGRDTTGFDLWFATPATGFYFGVAWGQRRAELAQQPAAPVYPQFLYQPKLRTWLRYNSAEYFCLVQEGQLQVRRERPQELFKPEEVEVSTEAAFLKAYQRTRALLQDQANQYSSTYQRRGTEGNEWFYCNPIYAVDPQFPTHLRLNLSVDGYGRSWQLMLAFDMLAKDPRRLASSQEEFEQQLQLMLSEADAAATGVQEGGQPAPAPPMSLPLSQEEAEDFYLYGDPFDGTFSPHDDDDGS